MTSEALTLFSITDVEATGDEEKNRRRPAITQQRPSRMPRSSTLPPTLDVVTAARLLGVGRTVAYRMVRRGEWPTHVVRAGRKILIPTAPLLEFLGLPPRIPTRVSTTADRSDAMAHNGRRLTADAATMEA